MKNESEDHFSINAIAFKEGDAWVIQGIEYDIVVHTYDVTAAPEAFMLAVIENMLITEHLGRAPFFRYFAKPESAEESIEELVVAASMLSAQRIGAIIAIERQIGLRNYIEGGIPLDGTLTYDLLLSIFQPASPLHDGAVIVRDDRVAAAACFLPLTVNPKLSKDLGSRHRAAIGLTEENDAVAIVVSEESGSVSVVADGEIERGLDADALRARLRTLVLQRRTGTPKGEAPLQYT